MCYPLLMSEPVPQHLLDIGSSGHVITLLLAPPGYRKRWLMIALAAKRSVGDETLFFDRIDHQADPRTAAKAVLAAKSNQLVMISHCSLLDREFFTDALFRHMRQHAGSHVVIALDHPDELPLADLRSNAEMQILGVDHLQLDLKELGYALRKIGRKKDRDQIAKLGHTWPVAIDLLTKFALGADLQSEDYDDADLVRLSGLYEFMEQRLLPLLAPNEQNALVQAAFASNPTKDLLRPFAASDRILAGLTVKLSGLVERKGNVFSLNPALRNFVSEYFLLKDPEAFRVLMLETADQCSRIGRLGDAARLAAAASDPQRIHDYAEKHGALSIWVLCGFSELRALVDNASAEVISNSPILRMMRCVVYLKSGNIRRAEEEFSSLSTDLDISAEMARELEIIRVTLLVYGCSLARQHDLETLAGLLNEHSIEPAWQTYLATLGCVLNSQRGRFSIARSNLREARQQAARVGSRYNRMFLELHEAVIELAQGNPGKARSHVSGANKTWRKEFADDVGVETVISALRASIEFETGRLTSARNALRLSARRMPEAEAWFDIYFAAYEPYARINLRDEGLDHTLDMLAQEQSKLCTRGLSRVASVIGGLATCLSGEARLQGNSSDAATSFDKDEKGAIWSWQEHEIYTLAQVHSDYADGQLAIALKNLDKATAVASQMCLVRSVLRYKITTFLIHAHAGTHDVAEASAIDVIRLGQSTGMRQIIVEMASKQLVRYASGLLSCGMLNEPEEKFIARLVNNDRSGSKGKPSQLTPREREVVSALMDGGSDKEMARALGISDHGIRYHLKNIYRKLQVHDRLSAVSAARRSITL